MGECQALGRAVEGRMRYSQVGHLIYFSISINTSVIGIFRILRNQEKCQEQEKQRGRKHGSSTWG